MLNNDELIQKCDKEAKVRNEEQEKKDADIYEELNSISFRLSLQRLNTFYLTNKDNRD